MIRGHNYDSQIQGPNAQSWYMKEPFLMMPHASLRRNSKWLLLGHCLKIKEAEGTSGELSGTASIQAQASRRQNARVITGQATVAWKRQMVDLHALLPRIRFLSLWKAYLKFPWKCISPPLSAVWLR